MVCDCATIFSWLIIGVPMISGLILAIWIDDTYFRADREQLIIDTCGSLNEKDVNNCTLIIEPNPLFLILPISFVLLSLSIARLYYLITSKFGEQQSYTSD